MLTGDPENGCIGYQMETHPGDEIHLHPTVGCYNDGTVPAPRDAHDYVVEGPGHERLSHHRTKSAAMEEADAAAKRMNAVLLVYDENDRVVEEKDYRGRGADLSLDTLATDPKDLSLESVMDDNEDGGFF